MSRRRFTEIIVCHHLENDGLPLTLKLTASGFFLQLTGLDDTSMKNLDMPAKFINITRKGHKTISCSTLELIKYNNRMNESLNEIYVMSCKYFFIRFIFLSIK